MKKIIALLLAICLLLVIIGLELYALRPKPTITVYSQGDYIDPNVLTAFTRATGIQVSYTELNGSVEQADTKTLSDVAECDLLLADTALLSQLEQQALLLEIDWDQFTSWNQIDMTYLTAEVVTDSGSIVPCLWTTMGLLYNPTLTEIRVTGWSDLFRTEFAGRIAMPGQWRELFSAALLACGLDVNTERPEDIAEAAALLSSQESLVLGYYGAETLEAAFQSEQVILAPCYASQAMQLMSAMPGLSFVIPPEGSWQTMLAYAIPAQGQHREDVYELLNYLCQAEQLAKNAVYSGYSVPSSSAYALLNSSWQANPLAYPNGSLTGQSPLLNTLDSSLQASCQAHWLLLQQLTIQKAEIADTSSEAEPTD